MSDADDPVTQSPDTSPEIEALQIAHWRRMAPCEKIALLRGMQRGIDGLAIAGILARHPSADEGEIQLRLAALKHGRDFAVRHFRWDPDVRGW